MIKIHFNRWAVVLLALIGNLCLSAQTTTQTQYVLGISDTLALSQLKSSLQNSQETDKQIADSLAVIGGLPIEGTSGNGAGFEIIQIGDVGPPTYLTTFNINSAKSISTNEVQSGGAMGLNLDGTGYVCGVWDQGKIETSHVEFDTRAIQSPLEFNGQLAVSGHATHVAGTVGAKGLNINAKGMASDVLLESYDWVYDFSEMSAAAGIGLLASNHSYGAITGWHWTGADWWFLGDTTISSTEDYKFGFYSSASSTIDQIAQLAPAYTMVYAAGNDRGEGPLPGTPHFVMDGNNLFPSSTTRELDGGSSGYDCLSSYAVAKNAIVVGSVADISFGYSSPFDVQVSSFSSWGMTDDGRIKPDIVANGEQVFSTWPGLGCGPVGYCSRSGTSMAAPSVSGSILLLQEHYGLLNPNSVLRSATIKALILHTAREAGMADGPDYQHGWGLMNTSDAVNLISISDSFPDVIQEQSLANGDTFSFDFAYSGMGDPFIRATIAWTDLPGIVPTPSIDPSDLMLVNDLDLRITNLVTNQVFEPWVLDPTNPANAATTGDNFRDNVEQVYISNPTPGATYRVTITHKDSLGSAATQDFGLILSGLADQATVELDEEVDAFAWVVYPNPASDVFQVSLGDNLSSQSLIFEMWDQLGRKRYSSEILEEVREFQVDSSTLEAGNYWAVLRNEQGILSSKRVTIQ